MSDITGWIVEYCLRKPFLLMGSDGSTESGIGVVSILFAAALIVPNLPPL